MADHWIENHKRDSWRRQAKASGYRARSAFKLIQIQKRFKLIREGDVVLDVGCHPGGWAQVAVELTGEDGVVIGVDLEPCQPVEGATLLVGDITDDLTQDRILEELDNRPIKKVYASANFLFEPENLDKKIVLITGHRRESFGDGFLRICQSIQQLAG